MQFNVCAVENIISTSPRKNGAFNLFFKLNDKIGIKLSTTKEQRDGNYHRQENAAKHNLGPNVYGMIDNVYYKGDYYFGYFTEVVDVIKSNENDFNDETFFNLAGETFSADIKDLVSDLMYHIGYNFRDCHYGNIGIKDGKFVCIDFDFTDTAKFVKFSEAF